MNILSKINKRLALKKMSLESIKDKHPNSIIGTGAQAGLIIVGIMTAITGFATLVIGNYIIHSIYLSLPALNSPDYNSTMEIILGYVTTVMPIFGMALMALGFGIVLMSLGVFGNSPNQR